MVILTGRVFARRTIAAYREATEVFLEAALAKHEDDERTIDRLRSEIKELRAQLDEARAVPR